MPQLAAACLPLPLRPFPNCADAAAIGAGMTARRRAFRLPPGIMPLALPHPTPRPTRTARYRWGCFRARASATDKSLRLLWRSAMHRGPMQCASGGALQSPPQAMDFIAFPHRPGLGDWPLHPAQTMPFNISRLHDFLIKILAK